LPCSCFLVANAVNLAQSLDIQMQHLPGLFPTGNAGWALFPPKMKSGSSRVYARPGTRCCGKGQDVTQFHHQSGALCAKPKWNQNLVPSVCPGIASGENFCPQDSQSLPACSGSSTFWRYAGLHQNPPQLRLRAFRSSAGSFPLDRVQSIWHSYGCSPCPRLGLLLSVNSSFTGLRQGEQPIGTLHLGLNIIKLKKIFKLDRHNQKIFIPK